MATCCCRYAWPGNIRELPNVIERAVIVCDTAVLSVDVSWLSRRVAPAAAVAQPLLEKLAQQEKEMIEAPLQACDGRVAGPLGAATRMGIPRSTLESMIRSLGISKYRFKIPWAPGSWPCA